MQSPRESIAPRSMPSELKGIAMPPSRPTAITRPSREPHQLPHHDLVGRCQHIEPLVAHQ